MNIDFRSNACEQPEVTWCARACAPLDRPAPVRTCPPMPPALVAVRTASLSSLVTMEGLPCTAAGKGGVSSFAGMRRLAAFECDPDGAWTLARHCL